MDTKTIMIICIVAVVLSSASLVLILCPKSSPSIVWMGGGHISYVTCTAGNPNGMISVVFSDTMKTNKITITKVYVNHTQQFAWTCYVNGVATSPAVVPGYSDAQINITTTVVAGNQYLVQLDTSIGTFSYTVSAPS